MDDDDDLLDRFLAGELSADAIAALEARLDAEPDLQRRLGDKARCAFDEELTDGGRSRVSILSRPPTSTAPELDRGYELREEIASGGMGTVRRARQRSVGRTVAVKTARVPWHADPLTREAMLTGYLEHPNIVPVHDIVIDDDGELLVVMKHIEGTVWRDTIRGPEERPLEWHVGIVIQVCKALRFAHSRGVVHRDIKPDNVMLGEFDEVYLLDWGLAASVHDGTRLPSLAAQRGAAGTPAYMAPEQMAEDAPAGVGMHTDVYLVGASLYEAVTGSPPQIGKTLSEVREQVETRGELELPGTVPDELAAVIRRAMAVTPSDRYGSIGELRDALEAFLEHRTSAALVLRGDSAAKVMEEAHVALDVLGSEQSFYEAAFNYRAALDAWSANAIAETRLQEVVRQRVEQLLERGEPVGARRALALADDADPELTEAVEAAVRAEEQARDRLRDYERGANRRLGLRTRRILGVILGGAWIAVTFVVVALPVTQPFTLLVGSIVFLAFSAVVVLRSRSIMLDLRLNRFNTAMGLIAQVIQVLMLAVATATAQPVPATLTELLLLWAVAACCIAVVVDRRIFATGVAFAAAYVACRLDPSNLLWALPATGVVMTLVSLAINIATERGAQSPG